MFDHIAFPTPYQTLDTPYPVQITVKRLDLIHPQISGNKFFKLKYNLLEAKQLGLDRKSTRLNSSHMSESRMPSSA